MNTSNISRDDWILGGLALVLVIALLFFPWYSISLGIVSLDRSATSSPYAIWGLLAMLASLAFIADLAVERLSPQTTLPAVNGSRTETRMAIVGVITLFLVIKFIAHIGDFGWGFYLSLVVLIALIYFTLQARAGGAGLGTRQRRPLAGTGASPTSTSATTTPPASSTPASTPPASPSEPPPSSPPPGA